MVQWHKQLIKKLNESSHLSWIDDGYAKLDNGA